MFNKSVKRFVISQIEKFYKIYLEIEWKNQMEMQESIRYEYDDVDDVGQIPPVPSDEEVELTSLIEFVAELKKRHKLNPFAICARFIAEEKIEKIEYLMEEDHDLC